MPTAPEDTESLLVRRTRAGLWLVLVTVAFFALADLGLPPESFAPAYALKALHAVLLLGLLAALQRQPRPALARAIALVTVNATYAIVATGDVLKGHEATTPLLCVTCSMAAAALIPWGLGAQLATAAFTSAGNLVVLLITGHAWGELVDPAASMAAAQGVAVFVALEFARFRSERARTERALTDRAAIEHVRADVRTALAHGGPEAARLERCARLIADGLDVAAAVLTVDEGRRPVTRTIAGSNDAALAGVLEHPRVRAALAEGVPLVAAARDEPWLADLGVRDVGVFPMGAGGAPIGLLALLGRDPIAPSILAAAPELAETLLAGIAQGRTEEARSRLLHELDRANRVKSEFVSTMSHELRTPLNVIMGYADMLGDPEYPEPAFALARIRQANGELLELIEATLDLNRLESGRDEPAFSEVPLDELWQELAVEFAPAARRGDVRLSWGSTAGFVLRTDRRKLRTVVKNLVDNALKFTPRGQVTVAVEREEASCILTVRDSGIGIPGTALPHIFDMFRQVDSSDRRSYRGVGLGLHIVRRLCAQLGAEISVTSEVGRGTTFAIRLPLAGPAVCAA